MKNDIMIEARLKTTLKRHAFLEGDVSLCGRANIESCDRMQMGRVSTRLKLYVWPKDDLNYCQRCRRSLDLRGLVV